MPGPAFVITRDDSVTDPKLARQMVRGTGVENLEGPTLGTVDRSQGYLRFPDDAVLLMIGNTQELLDACEEASDAGILMIGTSNDRSLTLLFARIQVSLIQTDTLIAIGSDQSLPPAHQLDQWKGVQWKGVTGGTDINYVTTRSDGEAPHQTRALPVMIAEIKDRFNKPWI
jgi:hypothetical protein